MPLKSIIFANISGFNTLFNLDADEVTEEVDIFCFCETWLESRPTITPSYLSNYEMFFSPAQRASNYGRASGGILAYCKEALSPKLLDQTEEWIFFEVAKGVQKHIIGSVYWKPKADPVESGNSLFSLLNSLQTQYPSETAIVVGGDFNARIGEENWTAPEVLEDASSLRSERESFDKVLNARGRILGNVMSSLGFVVCNGRTRSDCPANFTFISTVGKSVIDTVWCSHEALCNVEDLATLKFSHMMDHNACLLSFTHDTRSANEHAVTSGVVSSIRWKPQLATEFCARLEGSSRLYVNSEDVSVLYQNWLEACRGSASECSLLGQTGGHRARQMLTARSPWFNKECVEGKRLLRRAYRLAKRKSFDQASLEQYMAAKAYYKRVQGLARDEYFEALSETVSRVQNSKDFWSAIRKLKPKNWKSNPIGLEDWAAYFKKLYPAKERIHPPIPFCNLGQMTVENWISLDEVLRGAGKLKSNKATGLDGVPNEILKSLPDNWMHYLLNLFNTIFRHERVPEDWSTTVITLLHKKGPTADPNNYRGIALINTIVKLFTSILQRRLYSWAESSNVLPETQAGFRKGRSCIDNLFVLDAVVSCCLEEKRTVLGIFIDLRKAFDSVVHDKLWAKLHDAGVSGKIIRIIAQLYRSAKMRVKTQDGISEEEVDITSGVLQGETLSPLLFNIFIADFEEFFRRRGFRGVRLSQTLNVLTLAFADDMLLFASSWTDAKEKLDTLREYCELNSLSVNTEKTEVVMFRRPGRGKRNRPLMLGKSEIKITPTYTYLGVLISSSGKFSQMARKSLKKGYAAIHSVVRILRQAKPATTAAAERMFDATVIATALYGCEVWGASYSSVLEPLLTVFLKKMLSLPSSTPGHYLRVETGMKSIGCRIFERTLAWWIKILEMPPNRLPRQCFDHLLALDPKRENWVSKLRRSLSSLGREVALDSPLVDNVMKDELVQAFRNGILSKDISRILESSFNAEFRCVSSLCFGEDHWRMELPFRYRNLFMLLRLASRRQLWGIISRIKVSINLEEECKLCGLREKESLEHLLLRCPCYSSMRESTILAVEGLDLPALLYKPQVEHVKTVCEVFTKIIKKRNLLIPL